MQEIWKDIKNYEGLYQVSNFGNIKSLTFKNKQGTYKRELILKKALGKNGYHKVILQKDRNRKTVSVHRLVAEAFIPNPENKKCVNHLDCNRTNNRIDNLEWCTHSENVRYGVKCGNIKCNFLKRKQRI